VSWKDVLVPRPYPREFRDDVVRHNLQADAFIKDHSDVKGEQVAYSILSAIAST